MGAPKGRPRPAGSGRAKGTPNKTTRAMKELWLEAFEKAGGVNYLVGQAVNNPSTFMQGLLRQIPNEVAQKIEETRTVNFIDLSGEREDGEAA